MISLSDAQPTGGEGRCYLVRYLEPGRKRRRRTPSLTRSLWLIAAGLAVAFAIAAIIR